MAFASPLAQTPAPEDIAEELGDTATQFCGENADTARALCRVVFDLLSPSRAAGTIADLVSGLVPILLEVAFILVLAFVLSRLSRRAIRRFQQRLTDRRIREGGMRPGRGVLAATGPIDLSRTRLRTETIGSVLRSLSTGVVYGFALVLILGALGVNLGPLIAGAGIAGVALGFGAQNLVKDFLAGAFILLEDQYGIGDVITIDDQNGIGGTVEAVTLRVTRLRDVEGTVWWVPNGEIRRVGNKSQLWARSLLDIQVAYGTDPDLASNVIKAVADDVWRDPAWTEMVLDEPELWGVERWDESQLVIRLVVKVEPAAQWKVNREIRRRLLYEFDAQGIEIPFPQRTIWLRQEPGDGGAPGGSHRTPTTTT